MTRALPAALVGLCLGGCGEVASPAPWWEQPTPEGNCWDVDLANGLDQESTDEIHALYRCLNQDGAFAAMSGLDEAMDAESRDGHPLGVEVALLAEGLGGSDLDLFALAGAGVDLLQSEDAPILPLAQAGVELLYGQPYVTVVAGNMSLADPDALEAGVLGPVLPVVPAICGALLDEGDAIPALAADALASDTLDDVVCTAVGLATSEDDDVDQLRSRLLPDLGAAINAARSPENDRWEDATGDSLRDLVSATLLSDGRSGENALAELGAPLEQLLGDTQVRDGLAEMLSGAVDSGELDELPLWALHLAEVDANGTPLCDADTSRDCSVDDSALVVLVRLLTEADADVQCSVFGVSLYDGNFAIDLLQMIAGLDPDTAASLTDLAGTLLGWGVTGDLLDWVLGACEGIDDPEQLIADLASLDRLNDPDSGKLLDVLVDLLGALYAPDEGVDQLDTLLGVLAVAQDRELVPPLEEVLRDLASSSFVNDVVSLVPLLLDPAPLAVEGCPTDAQPLDWNATWDLLGAVLTQGDRDETPLATLGPVLNAALEDDRTWTAMGNLALLLEDREATLQDLLPLVATLVATDPDLSLLRDSAGLLEDEAITGPALRMCESEALLAAVGDTQIEAEGPLPFAARLVTGGTLEAVLRTVDLLLAALDG